MRYLIDFAAGAVLGAVIGFVVANVVMALGPWLRARKTKREVASGECCKSCGEPTELCGGMGAEAYWCPRCRRVQ
jgi:hypothetical protein